MKTSVSRGVLAAAVALLPVLVLLAILLDGPIWAGLMAWVVVAAVLLPVGALVQRAR
jgi:hypothetical protein